MPLADHEDFAEGEGDALAYGIGARHGLLPPGEPRVEPRADDVLFEPANVLEIELNSWQMKADRRVDLLVKPSFRPDLGHIPNQADVSAKRGLRKES